jgi:glucosamine kinase
MILVADSGSTKTDWIADTGGAPQLFHTPGFNPFFQDYDFVTASLHANKGLLAIRDQVSAIYFFGSGCSSPDRQEQIRKPLTDFFIKAEVTVDHDMLGCALSVCEGKPGIACILGTGSNTCMFDGTNLAPVRHGLGYVLGDEGSGSHFGKKILAAYLYQILPAELHTAFAKQYPLSKEDILNQVYKQPAPNVYLASFAPFLSEHMAHPWVSNLLTGSFREFFETNVLSYRESQFLPVHFTGSIAYTFREYLATTAQSCNVKIGNVIHKPVNGLAAYFFKGGRMPGK